MKIVNYRNTPFLRITIPFSIGLLLGDYFPGIGITYQIAVLMMTLLALFVAAKAKYEYASRWLFGGIAQVSLIVLGYLHIGQYNELSSQNHFAAQADLSKELVVEGIIYDAPVQGNKLKVALKVDQVYLDLMMIPNKRGHLLLYIGGDSAQLVLHYGDRIAVRARVFPVAPPANPYAFDYRNYLHHQNIHYNAFVKSADITRISEGHGNWVWAKAFEYRDRLLTLLQSHFTTTDEYAVASALLVGYKEDLSDDVKKAYADTGSMHALAVSGTHVGLLYVGILFLLQRLPLYGRRGRLIETLLALLAIWCFTFLTGATASVLRASVMFSTYLVGKMIFRQANIWNVLGASAFGLMMYNPYFLFDAGFQLSYAAVAGMAFFYPMFYKVSPLMKYKWMDEGWKILLVGFAAQIGTLPLSLYYFHQFPCYFWLSGWVVVLGGAIFLWAGSVLILLDFVSPFLAHWLGVALSYMLRAMNQIIFWIQDIPGSVVSGIWIGALGAIGLYIVIVLLGGGVALRRNRGFVLGVAGLAILLLANAFRSIQQYQQNYLCIYSINKARMIDMIDGKSMVTLSDGVIAKQENFAAQANRWAHGVSHTTGLGLSFGRDTTVGQVAVRGNILFLSGTKIAIIDQLFVASDTLPYPVNALLLSKNINISIAECLKHYPSKVVIFDQTNARKQVSQWKTACRELGVEAWDIREQGAWEWGKE